MPVSATENNEVRSMRLFIACPLPEGLLKQAEQVQLNNSEFQKIRWVPLENMHVTIFFLGQVLPSHLQSIVDKSAYIASSHQSFNLQFEEISLQKRKRNSGMIWIKFLPNENYVRLANALSEGLTEFMVTPPIKRPNDPIPHITLARWQGPFETEKINTGFGKDFSLPLIDYCELWQTIGTQEGVRYTSLRRFEMKVK
jgi:2'-5' RNA ligase